MALRAYDFEPERKQKETKKVQFKVIKNKNVNKNKAKKANKTSLVITTLLIFGMLIVINYRYNIISEKNLEVQRLQIAEAEANALVTNAEIEYSKMVDIVEVEAYAKQQLGMQEPEKSQMVYVGSEYNGKSVTGATQSGISNIINTIKQKISEIF